MLKRLSAIVLFGCFLLSWGFLAGQASSQHQPQNQQTTASNHDSNSGAQQNEPAKTWGERLSIIWNRTWDDPVAFYTFILSIFTGLLAIVSATQIIFLIRADKTARTSADAANKSAEAALSAQMPILVINFASLTSPGIASVQPANPIPRNITPVITLENVGRGPARIVQGCLEWTVVATPAELPLPPRYKNIVPYVNNVFVLFGKRIPVDVPCKIELSEDQARMIDDRTQFLWVFGYLSYEDIFRRPHETKFCLKWSPKREGATGLFGFVWEDETPEEYTKRT